jgi:hypothetical protein
MLLSVHSSGGTEENHEDYSLDYSKYGRDSKVVLPHKFLETALPVASEKKQHTAYGTSRYSCAVREV